MRRGARPPNLSQENSIFGRDRRRVQRQRAHTPAYANLSGSAQGAVLDLCQVLNISESGMCIQAATQMKTNRLLALSLELSETGARIHVVGHVVWSEASGRTGIRFPDMSEACRAQLQEWLEKNGEAEAAHAALAQEDAAPKSRVQAKPGEAVGYTSLVTEWSEIQKEVELCGPDLDPALHIIVQRALTMTWASGTAVALINKMKPTEMICRARAGTDSPELGAKLESGAGFSGECVRSAQAIVCDDTEYDSRVDRRSCRALGIRSILACPVKRNNNEVIGIIEVFSPEPAAFWENDITILRRLADVVAAAVRRAEHARADILSFPNGDYADEDYGPRSLQSFDNPELLAPPVSFRRKSFFLFAAVVSITAIVWTLAPSIAKLGSSTASFASLTAAEADSSPETYSGMSFGDVKKLAMSGNAAAEYSLGMRYATGEGAKQDYHEAREWFLRAADAGQVSAQAKVAAFYWSGRGGAQDCSRAYLWALLAQAGGEEKLSPQIVTTCAARLSPAQTNAERQAAEKWLHDHHIGRASDSE